MSREGLSQDDPGIRLLAAAVADEAPEAVALVCCGALPGLRPGATRFVTDVREVAEAGERCVPLDPGASAGAGFRAAVVWPRAHLGKDFTALCLAHGMSLLGEGGRLLCAARKNKGAESLAAILRELAGAVTLAGRDRGYALMVAERRGPIDDAALARHLEVRYAIEDPLLGDPPLVSMPGVFCRKHLDAGTRALIEAEVELGRPAPARIVDLGAGIGPLALWAARTWPKGQVRAVEANLLAVRCLRESAAARGLDGRLTVRARDGLEGLDGAADLVLCNPPTHAGEDEFRRLLAPLRRWLRPGEAHFVVNRPGRLVGLLGELRARVEVREVPGFALVRAHFAGA
ncbi:MAG: methyltransferase [Nannocystaceae bacterium]